MARPYPTEVRAGVLAAYEAGAKWDDIAARFNLSVRVVEGMVYRARQEGKLPSPVRLLTREIKAAVLADFDATGDDHSTVAKRHGLTRKQVHDLLDRRRYARGEPPATRKVEPDQEPDGRPLPPHVVRGLHGVSLPRLRCLEAPL